MVLATGTVDSTLDDKGRVVIPAAFRDVYKGKLMIMKGKDKCVWVLTSATYDLFISNFKRESKENNWTPEQIEAFERQHLSTVQKVDIDPKTGRIPISAFLRTYAKLTKDCLVVGIRGHLEIWNSDLHTEFMERMEPINANNHRMVDLFKEPEAQA